MTEQKTEMQIGDLADLLDLIEKTRDYPKLKAIHDKAMKELEEIAKAIEEDNKPPEAEPNEPAPDYSNESEDAPTDAPPSEEDRRA